MIQVRRDIFLKDVSQEEFNNKDSKTELETTFKNKVRDNRLINNNNKHECLNWRNPRKTQFTAHIDIFTGKTLFKCKICNKSFRHKNNLAVHLRIHTGEKLYKCNICQKCFSRKDFLKKHLVYTHNSDKVHEDVHFEKPYRQENSSIKVLKNQESNISYECDHCKKSFGLRRGLISHLKIHTKSFEDKTSFSNQTNLLKHHSNPEDEKAYVCEYCKKAFNQKGWEQHLEFVDLEKFVYIYK